MPTRNNRLRFPCLTSFGQRSKRRGGAPTPAVRALIRRYQRRLQKQKARRAAKRAQAQARAAE